jgi:DNA-binding NarL/FixJ family response regulator
VRVALAEDSTIFRNSLTLLLDAMGIDVVLAVGDGPALIAGIAGDPPDTVVLDARMPPSGDQEGFRVAERVHRLYPQVGILLFSNYSSTRTPGGCWNRSRRASATWSRTA